MNSLKRISPSLAKRVLCNQLIRSKMTGERGSEGVKGGGAVREAGGSLGKREAAQEEVYFRKQAAEQLAHLKDHLQTEIETHQKLIREHEAAIEKTRESLKKLQKGDSSK